MNLLKGEKSNEKKKNVETFLSFVIIVSEWFECERDTTNNDQEKRCSHYH